MLQPSYFFTSNIADKGTLWKDPIIAHLKTRCTWTKTTECWMIEPIRVCIDSEHYMSTRIWFQVSFVWENSALRIILHQNMTFYSIRFMTGPLISSDTSRLFFLGKWHITKMILGILRAKSVENRDVSRHPEKLFKGHCACGIRTSRAFTFGFFECDIKAFNLFWYYCSASFKCGWFLQWHCALR